jgi:hypothetical protein
MAGALTPLFAVAALVLAVAGVAKLRAPRGAVQALGAGRLKVRAGTVRGFAAGECVLGLWCLLAPGPAAAGLLAAVYATFAALTLMLARRHAACGCFGERDAPASPLRALLSGVFAAVALFSAAWVPHGAGWLVAHGAVTLAIGIAGCAYGVVVAYTELPAAWSAWSVRSVRSASNVSSVSSVSSGRRGGRGGRGGR